MKSYLKHIGIALLLFTFIGCGQNSGDGGSQEKDNKDEQNNKAHENERVVLTQQQFEALQMEIDTLSRRNMSGYVEANGQLEVPPQNEATITSVIGANIVSIEVIEGDEVKKGQVLVYLSHPNIIEKQTDYLNAYSNNQFLKKDYERQMKLYKEGVGSGAAFQKTEAEYNASKSLVSGLEAQLRQLNINVSNVRTGNIQQRVALRSPIDGAVQKVEIKTGQYVDPQTDLMDVVNTHHVHADLMVFEKDVHRVRKGQKVLFDVQSNPDSELTAVIYSVGKTFEENPKALHVHAEIENKEGNLIPGMYIRGRILTDSTQTIALPESAIAQDGEKSFVFVAIEKDNEWVFESMEVTKGTKDDTWIAVRFLRLPEPKARFAFNNAYYLMAEMSKGEHGHDD